MTHPPISHGHQTLPITLNTDFYVSSLYSLIALRVIPHNADQMGVNSYLLFGGKSDRT